MTGRINYTPEAEQQLQDIDDWITGAASAEIARRFVSAIMDHIVGIPAFPLVGRASDDIRPVCGQRPFERGRSLLTRSMTPPTRSS